MLNTLTVLWVVVLLVVGVLLLKIFSGRSQYLERQNLEGRTDMRDLSRSPQTEAEDKGDL